LTQKSIFLIFTNQESDFFLLKKEQMGCKLGTSVLGFEDDMAAYLDDGVLEKFGVGLFETKEASELLMAAPQGFALLNRLRHCTEGFVSLALLLTEITELV